MARYDFQRLRKDHGITQKQLADKLNLSQGFLSSVEKMRNPFPDERVQDLISVFPDTDLSEYELSDAPNSDNSVGSHNKYADIDINDPSILKQLLNIVAKVSDESEEARKDELTEAEDWRRRYDKAILDLDALRSERDKMMKENYELRVEIFRLKELLMKHHIDYDEKR